MPAEPSLDTQLLAELKDLLAENFNELIDRYTTDSTQRFALITAAVSSQDFKTLYYEAHGVKGSSRNMGATKLAEICGKLEALGQGQQIDGVAELFAAAQIEFALVCEQLQAYRV